MQQIEYRTDAALAAEEVARVFDASGIRRPTKDLARIARMFERADLVISAWDGERLVGVARSLTDFCWACYLSDLAVDRAYQHAGIGRELVRRTQERIGDEVKLLLQSAPEAMGYYPKLGFTLADNAFFVARKL